MTLTFNIDGTDYSIDSSEPIDLSIPLDFSGGGPHAFYLPRAEAHAVEAEGFVGDTRRGGGCNCETVVLNPHGNGTHTECVGHVSDARLAVSGFIRDPFVPGLLVTVETSTAGEHPEELLPGVEPDDRLIVASALDRAISALSPSAGFLRALIVRTAPNPISRKTAEYSGANPPYVSQGAMRLIRRLGVEHLLLDLPSADRESDGGALAAHRIFWGLEPLTHDVSVGEVRGTITEMVYADDSVPDGFYVLSLQIPNFLLDAAPSRPLIFPVRRRS